MIQIHPSLASADQINLEKQISSLGDVRYLHLDIEDGNFVPNLTFGLKTIEAIASHAQQILDAHLMVNNPVNYIEKLSSLGVNQIAVHMEALQYPAECLSAIRTHGGMAGLAFNCMTPVTLALPYTGLLDYLLIMTSEPDGCGQLFNPYALKKIAQARDLFPEHISIMVDGGIGERELPQVVRAGANAIVMGRAVWGAENPAAQYAALTNLANGMY